MNITIGTNTMYANNHDSITATELARNLATALERVRFQKQGILITKGNQVVAELRPPKKVGYPVDQLNKLLFSLPTLKKGSVSMKKDQEYIRSQANLPGNPWDL